MGDRTRMETLSSDPRVFIRPSPSQCEAGGVARRTRESILLAEAAGYDVIIVETVGVGQSEALVESMVDAFLLLQMPASGDELQGIKKGVLELADIICITKADGPLLDRAKISRVQLEQAMRLTRGHGLVPPVLLSSATEKTGIDEVWNETLQFVEARKADGQWKTRRQEQTAAWFDSEVRAIALQRMLAEKSLQDRLEKTKQQVLAGAIPASTGAESTFETWFKSRA